MSKRAVLYTLSKRVEFKDGKVRRELIVTKKSTEKEKQIAKESALKLGFVDEILHFCLYCSKNQKFIPACVIYREEEITYEYECEECGHTQYISVVYLKKHSSSIFKKILHIFQHSIFKKRILAL